MLKPFDIKDSKGQRNKPFEKLLVHELDNPFMTDFLKIIQSKSCRRLAYKTQVLCLPENPHIRTRNVHTNEVIAISTTISEKLGLNTSLCQAIAAGHDIGHTPYGHLGEKILSELSGKQFRHSEFGVVVAQEIETRGFGLNLNYETLEGILYHSRRPEGLETDRTKPNEYAVVMFADKIGYTFSDLNDAQRYDYLTKKQIPNEVYELGENQRTRNDACIRALVKESNEKGYVSFSEGKEFEIFKELRKFMFDNVYHKIPLDLHKIILKQAYEFFESKCSIDPVLAVALLTDKEMNRFGEFMLETRKPDLDQIKHFGVFEIIPHIEDKKIDYSNPDLSWGK